MISRAISPGSGFARRDLIMAAQLKAAIYDERNPASFRKLILLA